VNIDFLILVKKSNGLGGYFKLGSFSCKVKCKKVSLTDREIKIGRNSSFIFHLSEDQLKNSKKQDGFFLDARDILLKREAITY